jgi:hypothetical protein
MKRKPILVLLTVAVTFAVARGGHELPVYPSYYPHEIEIATVAPEHAGGLLVDGKIHAYVGAPRFAAAPPDSIRSVESLGSFVIARINPSSPHAKDEASACAAVRAVARHVAANSGDVIHHPYPVTPFHGDYLHHADLVEKAKARLLGPQAPPAIEDLKVTMAGAAARRLGLTDTAAPDTPWDVEILETDAAELVTVAITAINGWLGPPQLKTGWYLAYLVLADAVAADARERIEASLQKLQAGDFADAVERINRERALVAELTENCRKCVIGYTVKREYFSADFSAGIENIAYDSLTGLNSPMFIRTAKLKDFPWNGWLALGIDARPTAAWNPIAGFTDEFGRLMWFAFADPAELPSPYDSSWMLNRMSDVQSIPRR